MSDYGPLTFERLKVPKFVREGLRLAENRLAEDDRKRRLRKLWAMVVRRSVSSGTHTCRGSPPLWTFSAHISMACRLLDGRPSGGGDIASFLSRSRAARAGDQSGGRTTKRVAVPVVAGVSRSSERLSVRNLSG